jgi:alkanesulfonate monooxygenase SsuD/methylene tetrahydromethanopterin reductase-like flavin-dependent oxidoreductase (luciferase family)
MKIGFSPVQGDHHYGEMIEEVRYAEANGLDSVFLQEHHEAEVDQYWSDPLTALAGVASVTDEIDLGTAILLLPLYDPVRLAERGAILDGLSDGRFVLGAAVGYRPREFELYETDRSSRGAMYEEYLTLVSRLWSEERVTFDGDFRSVEEFRCTPRPSSTPRPRIWVGGYHDVVLDRTARLRADGLVDCWFPGTQPDRDGLEARRGTFDGMLEDRGVAAEDVDQPLFRDGVIAETTEEAVDLAHEYLVTGYEKQYEGRGHEESERGDLGHDVIHEDYDPRDLVEDRFIVGDPDDWVEELRAYEDALGADHVVARIYFEGMSHGDVMDQLELLCSEVAPAV